MKDWLRKFFTQTEEDSPSPAEQSRIAAVALLYEVIRADGEHKGEELDALAEKLVRRWQLEGDAARQLIKDARQHAEDAVDYHQLVMRLREHYSAAERTALIADMWEIAMADGEIDRLEEYVIRKVADLLYVSHSDFIRGKLKHTL